MFAAHVPVKLTSFLLQLAPEREAVHLLPFFVYFVEVNVVVCVLSSTKLQAPDGRMAGGEDPMFRVACSSLMAGHFRGAPGHPREADHASPHHAPGKHFFHSTIQATISHPS